MLTDNTLTFATANLFNFVEPPSAFYDFENIYDAHGWADKCRWTAEKVTSLDADIIGLQEVFSIEATRKLFDQLGYRYFVTVDEPHIESDYIYTKPVVALASRFPITHFEAVTPPCSLVQDYNVECPRFSRQPIYAVIDAADIGQVAVYVCHLKSQRATESNNPESDNALLGVWLSSQQRGWEAVMLRHFMQQKYRDKPMPTALMGDMNQTILSDTTGMLVKDFKQPDSELKLEDSWQIFQESHPSAERAATHYHFARGNVLDYVLLSQEFQTHSSYSMADVSHYRVLDQHLINPNYSQDKQASDHAFVAVTVRFVL